MLGTKRKLIFETCANCGKKIEDDESAILVDADNDLVFCQESCLQEYFSPRIEALEEEHLSLRSKHDLPTAKFPEYEYLLSALLNDPDEVWEEEQNDDEEGEPLAFFIGEFLHKNETVFYCAAVYLSEERPSFVLMHFPTADERLVQAYRRGRQIYDGQTSEQGEDLSPHEVSELDEFPSRLHEELMSFRSDEDIEEDEFGRYMNFIIDTLDEPEEMWQSTDEDGQAYLVFIKHHEVDGESVALIVMTADNEDEESGEVLFSIPTKDAKLLEKARVGQNILTEEDEED